MTLSWNTGLTPLWNTSTGDEVLAVEFGLAHEFMLPLASGKQDPFIGIVGALAELHPGELGLFQILWQPVQNEWAVSIVRAATTDNAEAETACIDQFLERHAAGMILLVFSRAVFGIFPQPDFNRANDGYCAACQRSVDLALSAA